MTRIVGRLDGPEGPLNGRLFVKAGGAFIGAPAGDLVFKIADGIVDIELPPCPAGLPYAVDWRAIGDTRRLSYVERWRVAPVEEMSLDEARGLIRADGRRVARASKGDLIEATMLRNEAEELKRRVAELEGENSSLLRQLSQSEGGAAAAQAQAASLSAELGKVKQQLATAPKPQIIETERVVERIVSDGEKAEEIAGYVQKIALLEEENQRLAEGFNETISLSTHFANLHAQIDRLSNEKQQLLLRIEELKAPMRTTSSLRSEAIANLDKLTNG
jgi:chromosome segregation ATPase